MQAFRRKKVVRNDEHVQFDASGTAANVSGFLTREARHQHHPKYDFRGILSGNLTSTQNNQVKISIWPVR